ncbi:hypothetical protein Tco_1264664 [Tanacetum coccineum]
MNEMIRNNLTVATMQVNVQFLQQLQSEWSRFVTIVKQQHKLDEVSYHKLFDILKQYQKKVNEIRTERMAKNANPLALVATAQTLQDTYYQSSKSHKSYAPTSKASLPTRSHATTRSKGKEIAKSITPPSESAFREDSDHEQAQRDKDMQKNLALIAKYFKKIYKPTNNNLRTSSNTRNKNVDTTLRKTARSRQKSYADKRRKPLEFQVGDRVLLKVSPWKGVVRFGKKGKLAPRYVGPFEIVERVGPVAYRLKLPQELSCVHDTFHVSNLKKCLAEPDVQVPLDEIEIDENLRFVEEPIEIVERDVKKLKRRRIPLVKVRWNSRQGAEYTWEHEDQFRKKYPHLFSETVPPSGVAT